MFFFQHFLRYDALDKLKGDEQKSSRPSERN